eukprot:m.76452 g.76452  ORF g.76452 m.76452 type:complete len:395 (+) comp14638_c0_seq1:31-1215(+)
MSQQALTRDHWQPDEAAPCCSAHDCDVLFTILERRHHCRLCGLVYCGAHVSHRLRLRNTADGHAVQWDPDYGQFAPVCALCYESRPGVRQELGVRRSLYDRFMRKRALRIESLKEHSLLAANIFAIEQLPDLSNQSLQSVVRWLPDNSRSACTLCLKPFNVMRWRHHCRVCGTLSCSDCIAPRRVQLRGGSLTADIPVCRRCNHAIDLNDMRARIRIAQSCEVLGLFERLCQLQGNLELMQIDMSQLLARIRVLEMEEAAAGARLATALEDHVQAGEQVALYARVAGEDAERRWKAAQARVADAARRIAMAKEDVQALAERRSMVRPEQNELREHLTRTFAEFEEQGQLFGRLKPQSASEKRVLEAVQRKVHQFLSQNKFQFLRQLVDSSGGRA